MCTQRDLLTCCRRALVEAGGNDVLGPTSGILRREIIGRAVSLRNDLDDGKRLEGGIAEDGTVVSVPFTNLSTITVSSKVKASSIAISRSVCPSTMKTPRDEPS